MTDFRKSLLASVHQCESPLAEAFFSPVNLTAIQNLLRVVIQQKTGYTIGRQSDEQVAIVMRAMYTLHAAHANPDGIEAEVRRLNAIVLSELAPIVGSNIAAYLGYLRDASTLPDPLPRGVNSSIKGSKTMEMFTGL